MKFNCVLNRCDSCPKPKIPLLELSANDSMKKIEYVTYQFQSKCKIHGLLPQNASICQKCVNDNLIHNSKVPEKS